MKTIWYLIIGLLLYYSISILVTQKTPSIYADDVEGQLELSFIPSLMMSAFFLYGAYIIWDELLRK